MKKSMSIPKLSELLEATAPIEFDFNGFPIKAVIRLNAISTDFLKQNDGSETALVLICERYYKSIDVSDDSGKPYSVTPENLRKFPVNLLEEMVEQVNVQRKELKKPISSM